MTPVPVYQIDAFSARPFGGNPAALVVLDTWLADDLLQAIAAENNLSETVYLVAGHSPQADYAMRWFTPTHEVELCGHATLASAWWLFQHGGFNGDRVSFETRSGVLHASRQGSKVEIDLPTRPSQPDDSPLEALSAALGASPSHIRRGANWIAVFDDEATIKTMRPDLRKLAELHPLGVIVTAPGHDCDIVSRYFAPSFGIDEDPVTGSAHADLAPYWCERLGQNQLNARQLSARGGELQAQLDGARVRLRGDCRLFLRGEILLP